MKRNNFKMIALVAFGFLSQWLCAQSVPQMMQTKYHQNAPFNNACPNQYASGCGAIAIAQIIKYYEQPMHGYGSMAYKSSNVADSLRLDFGAMNFDWSNILNEYATGRYSDVQANAVAQLVYACGTAMYSNYGNSTAVNNYAKMMYGLQHYLHISPESRYVQRKYYSTEEWISMLDENLRAGHPVFYRGSWLFDGQNVGHMYVVDGLNDNGEYHVNFGHGNSQDKFTSLQVINQNGTYPSGRPVCYNASQAMVINCFPTPSYDSYPRQQCMSDEPIILNEDFSTRETNVALGESFKLSCKLRNISHERASIRFGWALVKDGVRIKQLTENSYGLGAGNTFTQTVNSSVSLPKDLENGEYKLMLYSKSDLSPEWQSVVDNAPSTVSVTVNNGNAHVIVPDNHMGNPNLYLVEDVKEVATEMSSTVPGRTFLLHIANGTTNNFENTIRMEIETDGGNYTYNAMLPVYSQTNTEFHVTIPKSKVDLEGKTIRSIKAYYYYDKEDRYIQLSMDIYLDIANVENVSDNHIYIYNINGMLVNDFKHDVDYMPYLRSLPHGIYIVKDGDKIRKKFF